MLRAPEGVSLVINFTMATMILLMGAALMFSDVYIDVIQRPNRTYLAFIFYFYAVFRYVRGWQVHRKNQREKERERWKNTKL